jgi:Uma2 family endonuclease
MTTLLNEEIELDIPSWVTDLSSFRRWLDQPDFPENLPIWWLRGKVWVDMSREQGFSHNQVRTAITTALWQLVADTAAGILWSEGMFLANSEIGLGGNPDAFFTSHEAMDAGRVALIEGREGGVVEVHGTPDMVLEVVSRNSIKKDTQTLFEAYWAARISEYWLVDARKGPIRFEIWRRTEEGYVAARKRDGWLKSNVFGKLFRLVASTDRSGLPTYRLESR